MLSGVIRTEKQFVVNFTALMGFLAVGLFFGMVIFVVPLPGFVRNFARGFVHLGVTHITNNIIMIIMVGLCLSAFAHPVELVGLLISSTLVDTITNYIFNGVGLSLIGFAAVGALIVYLLGVVFELKHFGVAEKIGLVVTAAFLLVFFLSWYLDQLQHDFGVVFYGQPVQISPIAGYTEASSFAHVIGFLWGIAAAVGLRIVRYRVLDIE